MRYLLALLFLAGCGPSRVPHATTPLRKSPETVKIVWSEDWRFWKTEPWEKELRKRWPNRDLLIVYSHGTIDRGHWVFWPDPPMLPLEVEPAVRALKTIYPGKTIVLMVCNPGHIPMYVPNTIYGMDSIWMSPGDSYRWNVVEWKQSNAVGNSDQLIFNP